MNIKKYHNRIIGLFLTLIVSMYGFSQVEFQRDTIPTDGGDLVITFLGHGSLQFKYQGKEIFIDPVSQVADFSGFKKADAILVTHQHGDHLDIKVIDLLSDNNTELYLTQLCHKEVKKGVIVTSGEYLAVAGIPVEVVPAYNIMGKRGNGIPYHPKGDGNGYILTFSNVRVYVAGDTEWIPEMKNFEAITIAFLPVALPYTMSVPMAVQVAKELQPKILYPYHFNQTNPEEVVKLLFGTDIEVRIRPMK